MARTVDSGMGVLRREFLASATCGEHSMHTPANPSPSGGQEEEKDKVGHSINSGG